MLTLTKDELINIEWALGSLKFELSEQLSKYPYLCRKNKTKSNHEVISDLLEKINKMIDEEEFREGLPDALEKTYGKQEDDKC